MANCSRASAMDSGLAPKDGLVLLQCLLGKLLASLQPFVDGGLWQQFPRFRLTELRHGPQDGMLGFHRLPVSCPTVMDRHLPFLWNIGFVRPISQGGQF